MKKDTGLMNAGELIDNIIQDLNESVRYMMTGQYLPWCGIMANMAQKLNLLKGGIAEDSRAKDRTIEDLKQALRAAGVQLQDMTPEEYIAEMQREEQHEQRH